MSGDQNQVSYLQLRYAQAAHVQAGSTIKPLVVYDPAVAEGWSTNETIVPPNMEAMVNNYAGIQSSQRSTNVPRLWQESLNLPAVAAANELGRYGL